MESKNCFFNFVSETHHLNLLPEPESFDISDAPELKPTTVRLTGDMVATIDNVAQKLQISRQKFMFEMIDGGISLAIEAIAQAESSCRADRPSDDAPEEERIQFYEEIRKDLIRELVQ